MSLFALRDRGPRATHGRVAFVVFVVLFLIAGLVFVWPAWKACGAFPAPLDDVYIHADFARSTAHGHPFEWVAGQGYSSGETAPLYPFLLAPGVWIGLDDERIVAFAFGLAVLSLALAATKLSRLGAMTANQRAKPLSALGIAIGASLVWVSIGTLDFTFFSGMEAAAFFGAVMAALASAEAARVQRMGRASLGARVGAWGAAMVLLRPEAIVLVPIFALVAARGARTRSVWPTLLRAGAPATLVTVAILATNRVMTGDFASAGARLKLLGSNPYLDDVARAKELVLNLLTFYWKVLLGELGPGGLSAAGVLALLGVIHRRTRHAAGACIAGALVFAMLVSTNGAARYQGFRYYAPALALFTAASALGASALGQWARLRLVGPLTLVGLALMCAPRAAEARRFFARASANVHGQQVTMGKKIANELPSNALVMMGDAGAIPFFSRRSSVDALGLGGYRRMPFVRAAVHGETATLELVERIPKGERPTHLALYPNWFPLTTSLFGREIGRVTIEDNVICGGPSKVLYEAHFDGLGEGDAIDLGFPPPGLRAPIDAVDFADVESEAEHGVGLPTPNGGYTVGKLSSVDPSGSTVRFDGGRIVGRGRELSFEVRGLGSPRPRTLVVRGDDDGLDLDVIVSVAGCERLTTPATKGAFTYASCALSIGDGERISLRARGREARLFHAWVGTP